MSASCEELRHRYKKGAIILMMTKPVTPDTPPASAYLETEEAIRTAEIGQWAEAQVGSDPSAVHPDKGTADPMVLPGNIDRYQPGRLLGSGGMGDVRLCKDQIIGREVAMKVIRQEHVKRADLHARFVAEAQVQGQLEHPAILPVYDLGMLPDGTCYFTMKRLRGQTLADILDELRAGRPEAVAKYPRHRLLAAFATVCLAIDFAHCRGVLHRDLKPANIMLGDFGEVHVLDWGIAKLTSPGKPDETGPTAELVVPSDMAQTAAGKILGTLAYMAPEQAGELPSPLDNRGDVFSLGAILYELLTLKRLRPSLPTEQMFLAIHEGVDARASVHAPERDVPPELEAICICATGQKPEDRYPSARALHDAVQSFLAGDRDLELRKQMAMRHMVEAEVATQECLNGGEGMLGRRQEALRELGRVLVLAPDNQQALALLRKILTEPPKELPPAVVQAVSVEKLKRQRLFVELLLREPILMVFIVAMVLMMGVRDWPLFLLFAACAPVLTVLRAYQLRGNVYGGVVPYAAHIVTLCGYALLSRVYGPLGFSTGPISIYTILHALSPDRRFRNFVIGSSAALFLGLILLEATGTISRSYVFHDGALTILPQMAWLTAGPTLAMMTLLILLAITVPALILKRGPDRASEMHQQILLHNWHLSQILPEEGQRSKKGVK